MKTVAILGATGLTGSHLLKLLSENNEIGKIHVLSRRPPNVISDKIIHHKPDFMDLCELEIEDTIDMAYCCLGTTIKDAGSQDNFVLVDYKYVINFAEWAHKRECQHFAFISSIGARRDVKNFYLRTKGITEQTLQRLDFNTLSIFRPSLLIGERTKTRPLEVISKYVLLLLQPLLIGKLKKYRGVETRLLAKAILNNSLLSTEKVNFIESDQISNWI